MDNCDISIIDFSEQRFPLNLLVNHTEMGGELKIIASISVFLVTPQIHVCTEIISKLHKNDITLKTPRMSHIAEGSRRLLVRYPSMSQYYPLLSTMIQYYPLLSTINY